MPPVVALLLIQLILIELAVAWQNIITFSNPISFHHNWLQHGNKFFQRKCRVPTVTMMSRVTDEAGSEQTSMQLESTTADTAQSDTDDSITILGFGSLLSESSSKLTFPNLQNFRLGYVPNYRRVFGHPTSIFFRRNIANYATKEMSSLSVEPVEEGIDLGLVVSVFEVDSQNMMENGIPSRDFLEREEEFDIILVPYYELLGPNYTEKSNIKKFGLICAKSTDEAYIERWGQDRFDEHFKKYGIESIWTWNTDSGLRPCSIYLRHCYLAAKSMGDVCFNSFLDETFLVDRTTTVRRYIQRYPEVLDVRPPPDLASRYSG